jgi:hypothetical protein
MIFGTTLPSLYCQRRQDAETANGQYSRGQINRAVQQLRSINFGGAYGFQVCTGFDLRCWNEFRGIYIIISEERFLRDRARSHPDLAASARSKFHDYIAKDKLVIVQRGRHDTTLLFSKKNALSPLASGLGRLRPATLAVASGIPARFPAKFCFLTRERNQRSAVWACCELDSGDDHRAAEFYLQ